MSQCKKCNNCSFELDRSTGEMRCTSCGTVNLIGGPSSYKPQEYEVTKKGDLKRTGFMDNSF